MSACGGDDDETTTSSATEESETTTEDAAAGGGGPAEESATVDIVNFEYDPVDVTVAAGGEVTWVNEDEADHTATVEPGFDTGTLAKGDEKAVTLDEPGTYDYVCTFHPFMKGTVTVE